MSSCQCLECVNLQVFRLSVKLQVFKECVKLTVLIYIWVQCFCGHHNILSYLFCAVFRNLFSCLFYVKPDFIVVFIELLSLSPHNSDIFACRFHTKRFICTLCKTRHTCSRRFTCWLCHHKFKYQLCYHKFTYRLC